ncbi:MAG: FecR family protein [Sediminibacterium sp.]|nr:FecR family protein [Sediminibacterium sp.]
MYITKDLINKFLTNNCSAEEAEAVFTFLEENEKELDEILSIAEWDNIIIKNELKTTQSLYILKAIKNQLFENNKEGATKRHIIQKVLSIAACIILIAVGIPLIKNFKFKKETSINAAISQIENHHQITWDYITNKTNKRLQITLPDSSSVYLSKNSSIKFKIGKIYAKREIILNGEAFFKVAKNKEKPFIVFTNNITTTALGTSFKINTRADFKSKITVKLFTGKVVIKVKESIKNLEEIIYLLPGDEFLYNIKSKLITKQKIEIEKNKSISLTSSNNIKTIDTSSDIIFKNESLINVLEKLEFLFKININCNKKEIEQMNFSGTISKTDDIKNILLIISQMNGLTVENFDNNYIIKKEIK